MRENQSQGIEDFFKLFSEINIYYQAYQTKIEQDSLQLPSKYILVSLIRPICQKNTLVHLNSSKCY